MYMICLHNFPIPYRMKELLLLFIIPPRNEVRGGILESPCPSVRLSVDARLGKIARLGIGCRGGYFVPLGQPHSSYQSFDRPV